MYAKCCVHCKTITLTSQIPSLDLTAKIPYRFWIICHICSESSFWDCHLNLSPAIDTPLNIPRNRPLVLPFWHFHRVSDQRVSDLQILSHVRLIGSGNLPISVRFACQLAQDIHANDTESLKKACHVLRELAHRPEAARTWSHNIRQAFSRYYSEYLSGIRNTLFPRVADRRVGSHFQNCTLALGGFWAMILRRRRMAEMAEMGPERRRCYLRL